jgi:hypothetical protein
VSGHYWTGHGSLCSLDQQTRPRGFVMAESAAVTCRYCLYLLALRNPRELVVEQNEIARAVTAPA